MAIATAQPKAGIREAALEFAEAIRSVPEWRELDAARSAFQKDATMSGLMARYRRLATLWRTARARGEGLKGTDAMELANVQEEIQQHEVFVRQQQAVDALVSLLQEANEVITREIGMDFATNAAPQSGGCCG